MEGTCQLFVQFQPGCESKTSEFSEQKTHQDISRGHTCFKYGKSAKRKKFGSNDEAIAQTGTYLKGLESCIFYRGFTKVEKTLDQVHRSER